VRAVLVVAAIAVAAIGLLALHYSAHKPAYIVVHRGQPLPKHYIESWSFGNVTVVQVAPSHTVVSIGPWPNTTARPPLP
jgi:hypothetical protein